MAKVPYTDVSHLMGGYYPFYRRLYFISGVVLIGLLASWLGANLTLSLIACGASLGPLLVLEQWVARRVLAQKTTD